MTKQEEQGIYGVMAEFDDPSAVVAAARQTYAAGFRRINAYSPYPIEELSDAIGFHKNLVPRVVFISGILGCIGGFALQIGTNAIAYPLNVGGRPLISWPAMIPVAFECTILLAAFGAFLGNILMNQLPQPYHPVFNVPGFARASVDRFFLCIKADDPKFQQVDAHTFLASLGAKEVTNVER
jgi:Protein of unknown function (DUF3341)